MKVPPVCFHCDKPPTARRPLFYLPEQPDSPMHRACAMQRWRLSFAQADAMLVPFETVEVVRTLLGRRR